MGDVSRLFSLRLKHSPSTESVQFKYLLRETNRENVRSKSSRHYEGFFFSTILSLRILGRILTASEMRCSPRQEISGSNSTRTSATWPACPTTSCWSHLPTPSVKRRPRP